MKNDNHNTIKKKKLLLTEKEKLNMCCRNKHFSLKVMDQLQCHQNMFLWKSINLVVET